MSERVESVQPRGGTVLRGGTVIDVAGERRVDVRLVDGRIAETGDLPADGDAEVIDVTGLVVAPGFVDLHTHLREPGMTEAETIETGSRAAALGGYTAVVAMPNTDPTQDCVSVVEFVRSQGRSAGLCDVHPSGSITVGRAGEQLTPLAELASVGVHLFTDDGSGVQDDGLMRRALEYAGELGLVLAQHCEVARLTEERSAVDRAMFDPSTADPKLSKLTMTDLMKRRADLSERIEAAEALWMEASEALETA